MKMSAKRLIVLAVASVTLGMANLASATIVFDTQVVSVTGTGLTMVNAHNVTVTATGGTVNFAVFATVVNDTPGNPTVNDGFQTARGYILAGLPSGSGSVAGNNGPNGNLTGGTMVGPFNQGASVGPAGSGSSSNTTAAVDLNGNTFTDFGNLTTSSSLSLIPHSSAMTFNQNNGNSSSFKFFTFSMPITSIPGATGGSTNVSFTNTAISVSIGWADGISTATNGQTAQGANPDYVAKNTTNGTVLPSIAAVLTTPNTGGATNSMGLSSAAANTLTTPPSFTVTANASGYASAGTTITAVNKGSIQISDIGAGLVEVLLHSSVGLSGLSSPDFNGGTPVDLTGNLSGDADAANLLSFYPWANILIRYPNTTASGNDFFNFDVSNTAGATVDRIVAVPEPASLGLMTLGTLALLARRRKVAK